MAMKNRKTALMKAVSTLENLIPFTKDYPVAENSLRNFLKKILRPSCRSVLLT